MSDFTTFPSTSDPVAADEPRRPKHRRDDVPVDGEVDLSEFGENPDTEVAG
jgi:hypothetical protein